jgi:alanine racemase
VYAYEEGLELRDGGIVCPIVVLGPVPPAALSRAIGAGLEIALWDRHSFARDVASAAAKREAHARVHVKINTGLNRLGFEPHDIREALETYATMPEIDLTGIFSHLASAEEIDSPYTMQQLDAFQRAVASVEPLLAERPRRPVCHLAASAAAMLWPSTRLDMCRFGIALYGLWPSPQTREAMGEQHHLELRPALRYESELVVERTVAAGTAIGYGGTFHAPREMRIGVVPVGYGDGVPRALSNRGAFAVDGVVCPIVGRVAMNVTEIDITHAPGAHPGSAVTLIGKDGGASVTADDWAAWSDTINYEIVTRLPATLPRHFSR